MPLHSVIISYLKREKRLSKKECSDNSLPDRSQDLWSKQASVQDPLQGGNQDNGLWSHIPVLGSFSLAKAG